MQTPNILNVTVTRRSLLGASGMAAVLASHPLVAANAPILLPAPTSLADALAQSVATQRPLVVMVSLDGCPFCKIARENYLYPLLMQDKQPVVQIDMRSTKAVKDFKNSSTTHDQMVRSWSARVAPTVLFFGKDGAEVAERLVGGYIPDFYGAYLDERIKTARRAFS